MKISAHLKRIAKYAIFGSVGAGIGLVVTGFIIAIGADPPGSFNVNQDLIIFMFVATGALGALALGLAAKMNRVKITILFLLGAVGFAVYY